MTVGMDEQDPLALAEAWCAEGRAVALATVIRTWGSAPRPVGSHLAIDGSGHFAGSVSGGCVEGAVIAEALDVIASGSAKILDFGVADETAWRVGLSCGGQIGVLVQKVGAGLPRTDLSRLNILRMERRAAVSVTVLSRGETALIAEDDAVSGAAATAFSSGMPQLHDGVFLNVYRPPPRLIVIGAVHIAQALAPMAAMAGFQTCVVDPRTAFATSERFAGIDLVADWPEDVFPQRPLDAYTALAAVTHDPKIDDGALKAALEAGCFYVGALGSRKTHGRRVERLRAMRVPIDAIGRISAPIGLAIGAATPAEIAVAILADVIDAFRARPAGRPQGMPA